MGVSENVVYPIVPNGFADHYPYEKWLATIGNIPYFQTNPYINLLLGSFSGYMIYSPFGSITSGAGISTLCHLCGIC